MSPVTAVETTFFPEASSAQMSSSAPAWSISPFAMWSTQSASAAMIASRSSRGRHSDRTDATDIPGVATGLVVAVHEDADDFEVGMVDGCRQCVAADRSGGPLHDLQHRGQAVNTSGSGSTQRTTAVLR